MKPILVISFLVVCAISIYGQDNKENLADDEEAANTGDDD